MSDQPLKSLAEYSRFAAELLDRPDVEYSVQIEPLEGERSADLVILGWLTW